MDQRSGHLESPPEPSPGHPPGGSEAALSFCRALAQTLGPAYRVGLYLRDPPTMLGTWPPRRSQGEDPVQDLMSPSRTQAVNHVAHRGGRISVLDLPSGAGPTSYSVSIEVDTGALLRASRLLSSLAEPDGSPPEPSSAAGHLGDALDQLVDAAVEAIGVPVREMSRAQKQRVVKYLDDRGAFLIKKAVENVAARLGVSRFTIYNYLDQTNGRRNGNRTDKGAP